jgi:hypothetical protein
MMSLMGIMIIFALSYNMLIIELANHDLGEAASEGSAMNLFGFNVDALAATPWIVGFAPLGAGTLLAVMLRPRVGEAWGAVNAQLRVRGEA